MRLDYGMRNCKCLMRKRTVQYRTNIPQNIVYVARELANYMKVSEDTLVENARKNTERIFNIE